MSGNESEKSFRSGPRPVERHSSSGSSRIVPVLVVFGTVASFMALAWYAYQTGSQSLKEDDLLVVEADKTPMKEKPSDPGGMQFPNQDKTIFDTFSGSNQQPAKVERVLPTPEEPMSKNLDTSETKTWINDKLHKPSENEKKEPEQVIGDSKSENKEEKADDKKPVELAVDEVPLFKVEPKIDEKAAKAEAEKKAKEDAAKAKEEADKTAKEAEAKAKADKESADKAAKDAADKAKAAKDAEAKAKAEKEAADKAAKDAEEKAKAAKEAEAKAKAEKEAADKAAREKAEAEKAAKDKAQKEADAKKAADKPAAAAAATPAGKFAVQLGAYRSEQEARNDWAQMQKKYKQFSSMQPVIVKADLGEKGTYYRLRTGTFSTSGEAKAFCNTMTILGQACILPTK